MAFSRRDFLKGAMAAFAGALAPMSKVGAAAIVRTPGWNTFDSDLPFVLGIRNQGLRLVASGVHVHWPDDGNLREHPVEISFARVCGPQPDTDRFYKTLGDIANKAELLFGVSTRDPGLFDVIFGNHPKAWEEGRKNFKPVMVPYGFGFLSPVMISLGYSVSSVPSVIDAYGVNGGAPIIVPPEQVMVIYSDVKIMCRRIPRRIEDFDKVIAEHKGTFTEVPARQYNGQRERGLTDAQYDKLLFDANAQNQDLDAWVNVGEELKNFDPGAFRKKPMA